MQDPVYTPITVALVEDNKPIADLLAALLNGTPGFALAASMDNAEEAMQSLPTLCPRVAIVDLHLPGQSGIDLIGTLSPQMPGTQFMVFTVMEDPTHIFGAFAAGASGYLLKSTPPLKILEAISEIAFDGAPLSGKVARALIGQMQRRQSPEMDKLSPRERQILEAMAQGLKYQEVADALVISLDTVRTHMRHIYDKLQVHSRTEALNKVFPR